TRSPRAARAAMSARAATVLPAPVSVPAMKKASSVRATGPSPADGRDGDPGFAGPRHGRFRPPGVAEHAFVGGGQAAVRAVLFVLFQHAAQARLARERPAPGHVRVACAQLLEVAHERVPVLVG